MRLRFSRRAERDIQNIGDFIARDNPSRAFSFVRELRTRCRQLTRVPEASPLRPQYGAGIRMAGFGRYLILYVAHRDMLEIRRVMHGARNLDDADERD